MAEYTYVPTFISDSALISPPGQSSWPRPHWLKREDTAPASLAGPPSYREAPHGRRQRCGRESGSVRYSVAPHPAAGGEIT